MFSLAIRTGRWHGPNPAAAVRRRKCLPEYLRDWEIPPILAALPPERRPLFATALYTGMRQGELLGLRKSDLDLEAGTIAVSRSYDGPTVKGARAALLPIVDGLRPYLVAAIQASPSEVVFPRKDGSMQPRNVRFGALAASDGPSWCRYRVRPLLPAQGVRLSERAGAKRRGRQVPQVQHAPVGEGPAPPRALA